MKMAILFMRKKMIKPLLFVITITFLISCGQNTFHTKNIVWTGTMKDSTFLNFIDIEKPRILPKDTLLVLELKYALRKKKFFLLRKSKKHITLKVRVYDFAPNETKPLDTLKIVNKLTGESSTYELLQKYNKQLNPNEWDSIIQNIRKTNVYQMPTFTNDFVIGGESILFSTYTSDNNKTIIRYSYNDTLNKVIKLLDEYND